MKSKKPLEFSVKIDDKKIFIDYKCPNKKCGSGLRDPNVNCKKKVRYTLCPKCGQELDWGDE